ncbi:unnamed protein product [Schistosoma margrebowiei]|uniref:Uncharacterized protein n=1 Tax=Schistosoma margrebowiei TaxID=48269 RepID=A0A183M9K7_9TREM|nr:unnamed protein product [Schistosoma margrebowiei]
MKNPKSAGWKHLIQWTARMHFDNLDSTDDLDLLSHTLQQMHETTIGAAAASEVVGLNVHKRKSKIRLYNITQHAPIKSHVTEKLCRM